MLANHSMPGLATWGYLKFGDPIQVRDVFLLLLETRNTHSAHFRVALPILGWLVFPRPSRLFVRRGFKFGL